jgi:putative chitobiose transport system permease protein
MVGTNRTIRTRRRLSTSVRLVLAVVISALSLLPLLWALVSSLRPSDEIFANMNPLSWRAFVPSSVSLSNYAQLAESGFLRSMGNSLLITLAGVVGGLVVSSLAAYALAAIRFRGRAVLFAAIVVSFLIPFEAIAIPLATTFRTVGLENSYVGLVLPALGNGLCIFLLRQVFLGIPVSLSEAAFMDGAGFGRIFWSIYLPLSRSGLIGGGIIVFVFQWQSYLWPLLIAPDPNLQVAPVAIANFSQQNGVQFGPTFAGTFLVALVPLILLLVFQRQFTGSMANAGSKE